MRPRREIGESHWRLGFSGDQMTPFEPELVKFDLPSAWAITYHALYALDPDDPKSLDAIRTPGFSLWESYFHQDLLQVEDVERRLLIDVGWVHDSDPDGTFLIRLLAWRVFIDRPPGFDWGHPLIQARTRSLSETIEMVRTLTCQ